MPSEEKRFFTLFGRVVKGNRLACLVSTTSMLTKDGVSASKYH